MIGLEGIEFTPQLINEIVLWKVNRFVELDGRLLTSIEGVKRLKPGEHRRAESVLASLLDKNVQCLKSSSEPHPHLCQ